jgi:hypothetical protein
MQLTVTDYHLAAAHAAHAHLVRLHTELTVALVLAWLRENRQHPHAGQIDTAITLYRVRENLQDLYDANELVAFYEERKAK